VGFLNFVDSLYGYFFHTLDIGRIWSGEGDLTPVLSLKNIHEIDCLVFISNVPYTDALCV